jgi:hypothetical protein
MIREQAGAVLGYFFFLFGDLGVDVTDTYDRMMCIDV